MAKNYKPVEYSSTTFESRTYHKSQNFSNTDEGISSIHYRSESLANYDDAGPMSHTISGSHYNLLNGLLFDSSSFMNATYDNVHRNKFPSSGSVIYIPQQYYGEEIKPKSFKLIDDSTAQQIRIVDDGNGNLYSLNAKNSRSAATSISSSDNYVGNIQYQMGVAFITETGSWSGSTNILAANISSSMTKWTPYATGISFFDRVPTIYGKVEPTQNDVYLPPGDTHQILWPTDTIDINALYLPEGIVGVIGGDGAAASRMDNGSWEGSLQILEMGQTYTFINTTADRIKLTVSIPNPEMTGIPLIVGKFPRAIKIDKDSDLTIIIRYDT